LQSAATGGGRYGKIGVVSSIERRKAMSWARSAALVTK
jgi:hypothetical protein